MPQTFYVTQDEEILSIVGRLRSSELLENVFIIPKRALILQSIVNLRILAREAQKLGKSVAIITQDEEGRALVEKAGIATRSYAEESPTVVEQKNLSKSVPSGVSIGSDDFFQRTSVSESKSDAVVVSVNSTKPLEVPGTQHIRVRGNPVFHGQSRAGDIRRQEPKASFPGIRKVEPVVMPAQKPIVREPIAELRSPLPADTAARQRTERLSRIFRQEEPREISRPTPEKRQDFGDVGKKGKLWFVLFSVISISFLGATAAFVFLPRADIHVIPQSVAQDTELEFEGRTADVSGDRGIPVRLVEKEGEVSVTGSSSGSSSSAGEKAKGKVVVYNEYSSDPQSLVATTRLESSDGKIFRLSKGITVPGMSSIGGKQEPGAVEAEVVADEIGDSFNIGPSEFTIPGFKGGPKYSKFSAKSQAKMSGGFSGSTKDGGSGSAISSADIDRAKGEAEKKFRSIFEEMLKAELSDGERFIIDSADVSTVGSPSVPSIGTVSSEFEYKAKFKGKIFVFSEDDLKRVSAAIFKERPAVGSAFHAHTISFSYGNATADYASNVIFLKARVSAVFVADIDADAVKRDFLGKSGDDIRTTLEGHPEIKKLDIVFKPKLFSSSIPGNESRVSVIIELP